MNNYRTFEIPKFGTLKATIRNDKVYVCLADLCRCVGISSNSNVTKYMDKNLIIRVNKIDDKTNVKHIGAGFIYIEEFNLLRLISSLQNANVVNALKKIKKLWIDVNVIEKLKKWEHIEKVSKEIIDSWDTLTKIFSENYPTFENILLDSKCSINNEYINIKFNNVKAKAIISANDIYTPLKQLIQTMFKLDITNEFMYKFQFCYPKETIIDEQTNMDNVEILDIQKIVNNILNQRNRRINAIYSDEMRYMIYIAVKIVLKKPSLMNITKNESLLVQKITTKILDCLDKLKDEVK